MSPDEMRALLRSSALELEPRPEVVEARVRRRGAEVRRTNRRGITGLVVLSAALAAALGPGIPDRLVPAESRAPAAQAAVLPTTSALLRVVYASGAYDSFTTESRVAACTPEAALSFAGGRPAHEVAVEGTAAEVARVRACLAKVPGASVSG